MAGKTIDLGKVRGNDAVYGVVNSTADGLAPKTGGVSAAKYLRADATWQVPPDTTYTGSSLKMTGYAKGSDKSAVITSDSVNQAVGKLENQIDEQNTNLLEGFSALTASKNGIFKHPSGLLLQWGNYPSNAMDVNTGTGGYSKTFSFAVSFLTSPQVFTSSRYPKGNDATSVLAVTASTVSLFSNVSLSGFYVVWLAIGEWK